MKMTSALLQVSQKLLQKKQQKKKINENRNKKHIHKQ